MNCLKNEIYSGKNLKTPKNHRFTYQNVSIRKKISRALKVFLLWTLLAPAIIFAQDHIIDRSWLEDYDGKIQWPDVQNLATEKYSGTLSKGFGSSAIWLRLRIDPLAHPGSKQSEDRLFLRIRPVYLDDIRVYDPLAPQGMAGVLGDTHHPRLSEFRGLDFLLPIARGTQPRDIWLRLSSTSTRQIDVQALNFSDLNVHTLTQSLAFSGYVGLVAILAIWAIVHWLFCREAVIGAFGIMQTGALLFALSSLGHLRATWPVNWPAWFLNEATTIFSITAVTAAEWFHIKMIAEFSPPPWIRRLHSAMICLLPIKILLLIAGWTTAALRLNMYEMLLIPWVFMASILMARAWSGDSQIRPTLSRSVMIGFYTVLLLIVVGAALPALGITQSSEIALYIVQLHGLVTALLLLLMLQYRGNVITQQQRETTLALERSLLQTRQERDVREEQEKLLAMLAHELKTPLATMHMRLDGEAHGSKEIKQAINDMTSVIDRCQQTLQLSDKQLKPRLQSADLTSLVVNAVSSCQYPHRVQSELTAQVLIHTDPQLLSIILNNLLENACKYSALNSMILIKTIAPMSCSEKESVKLQIINEPGIAGWPDSHLVFQKYYRSPHARRQTGTGLGLFLVENLAHVIGALIQYKPTDKLIVFEIEFQ